MSAAAVQHAASCECGGTGSVPALGGEDPAVVDNGAVACPGTTDGEGYPVERDGRVVWACCESSIGGGCRHYVRQVSDRVETLAELVQEWADQDTPEDQGPPLQEAMDRMDAVLEQLHAPAMTEDERAAVVARIEG